LIFKSSRGFLLFRTWISTAISKYKTFEVFKTSKVSTLLSDIVFNKGVKMSNFLKKLFVITLLGTLWKGLLPIAEAKTVWVEARGTCPNTCQATKDFRPESPEFNVPYAVTSGNHPKATEAIGEDISLLVCAARYFNGWHIGYTMTHWDRTCIIAWLYGGGKYLNPYREDYYHCLCSDTPVEPIDSQRSGGDLSLENLTEDSSSIEDATVLAACDLPSVDADMNVDIPCLISEDEEGNQSYQNMRLLLNNPTSLVWTTESQGAIACEQGNFCASLTKDNFLILDVWLQDELHTAILKASDSGQWVYQTHYPKPNFFEDFVLTTNDEKVLEK
jgi:hypothetical protein